MNLMPEIPARLKDRPLFRGMPVPFTTFVGEGGVPDFKITDITKWFACVNLRDPLCSICGQALEHWAWYIGGPQQLKDQVYFDPAMHEECARYAAATCPFIAFGTGYAKTVKHHPGAVVLAMAKDDFLENPEKMYLSKHRRDQIVVSVHRQRHYIRVQPPVYFEEIPRQPRTPNTEQNW